MAKYRVSANLVWDIEATDSTIAEQKAMDQLLLMAKSAGVRLRKPKLSLNKLKEMSHSTTLAEYPPDEILSALTQDGHRKEYKIGNAVYKVKLNSQRYFTFQANRKCVSCGIEGTKMLLELPHDCEFPHFNLYAYENDQPVLMTKDHKIPVARGGKDVMENYQTMCAICNNIKGKDLLDLGDLKTLRATYSKGVAEHMSSTQLHQTLQLQKTQLMENRIAGKVEKVEQAVPVAIDLQGHNMPLSPTSGTLKFGLILLIVSATVVTSYFNPFYAIGGLLMAMLGYAAGKMR